MPRASRKPRAKRGGAIKTTTITLTPKGASELLATQIKNRRLSEMRVQDYARRIRAGEWVLNGESIKVNGDGSMIDGQHRCAAVVAANESIETVLVSGLPSDTFDVIDQGKKRTAGDVLGMLGEKNAMRTAAVCRLLHYVDRVGTFYTARGAVTPRDAEAALRRHKGVRESVATVVNTYPRWMSGAWYTVMRYLTEKHLPGSAEDFWDRVASGTNLEANDPRYRLRERLIQDHAEMGGRRMIHAMRCIQPAWNAHREKRTLMRLLPGLTEGRWTDLPVDVFGKPI